MRTLDTFEYADNEMNPGSRRDRPNRPSTATKRGLTGDPTSVASAKNLSKGKQLFNSGSVSSGNAMGATHNPQMRYVFSHSGHTTTVAARNKGRTSQKTCRFQSMKGM